MYGDDEIKNTWDSIDENVLEQINTLLQNYQYDLLNNITNYVASLCNIDPYDMLSVSDKVYISQSRWLLWYSWRYMTHESYEKIAEHTCIEGHVFNTRSVAAGIEKMAKIIEQEKIWEKRWSILKHIIKLWKSNNDMQENKTITINIPKDMDIKVKINKK